MRVSVVVPVYNGAHTILALLHSLSVQSYPPDLIEIILVDNGSKDHLLTLLEKQSPLNVALLTEPTPTSYAARNCGILNASGDLIALTDADCILPPDWISKAVHHFEQDPQLAVLWGSVKVELPASQDVAAHHVFDSLLAFSPASQVGSTHLSGFTANLFVRRSAFSKVGLFDSDLPSVGDAEWGQRAYRSGLRILVSPDVVVYHPARQWQGILTKSRRVAGGLTTRVKKSRFASATTLEWLRFGFVPPVLASAKLLAASSFPVGPRLFAVALLWQQKVYAAVESLLVLWGKQPNRE